MPPAGTMRRNLKSDGTPAKLADSAGLSLYLSPSGGKLRRLDYQYGGKRKKLSFGAYPAVSLKDARRARSGRWKPPGVWSQRASWPKPPDKSARKKLEWGFDADIIEAQRARREQNAVRGACNHPSHLEKRRELLLEGGRLS